MLLLVLVVRVRLLVRVLVVACHWRRIHVDQLTIGLLSRRTIVLWVGCRRLHRGVLAARDRCSVLVARI